MSNQDPKYYFVDTKATRANPGDVDTHLALQDALSAQLFDVIKHGDNPHSLFLSDRAPYGYQGVASGRYAELAVSVEQGGLNIVLAPTMDARRVDRDFRDDDPKTLSKYCRLTENLVAKYSRFGLSVSSHDDILRMFAREAGEVLSTGEATAVNEFQEQWGIEPTMAISDRKLQWYIENIIKCMQDLGITPDKLHESFDRDATNLRDTYFDVSCLHDCSLFVVLEGEKVPLSDAKFKKTVYIQLPPKFPIASRREDDLFNWCRSSSNSFTLSEGVSETLEKTLLSRGYSVRSEDDLRVFEQDGQDPVVVTKMHNTKAEILQERRNCVVDEMAFCQGRDIPAWMTLTTKPEQLVTLCKGLSLNEEMKSTLLADDGTPNITAAYLDTRPNHFCAYVTESADPRNPACKYFPLVLDGYSIAAEPGKTHEDDQSFGL